MSYSLGSGDTKFDTADDFIGGTLIALKDIPVLNTPGGSVAKTIKAGGKVGTVYSFLNRPEGVYWIIENDKYVKHGEGLFDKEFLIQSIKLNETQRAKEISEAAAKKQVSGIGDLINVALPQMKWILLVVFVVVLIAVFYRISGK